MSIRHTTSSRRAVAIASLAAAMAFAVSGCGGDDGAAKDAGTSTSSKPASGDGKSKPDTAAGENVDPNVKLAEVRGRDGFLLVVNEVKRDTGGFITVSGEIKNTSETPLNASGMEGAESALVAKNPNSVAGATLVDKVGKKRYYVLRDTDNRCLCTTSMLSISPGQSNPIFMQFPATPASSTEVDFTLPGFATTSLKISG
ncbi:MULTISPECIES: hypothetical protein [unclassified Streptomyces]|uniref:hypothetical protein n=1 Tax=unclassified Streptomyces TaxID=2593676 RepID=UPI00093A7D1E|nr:hypothetical protein [Streptomyces sp. CB02058]OKI97932.1 hypothetical protein AMK10_03715 [Streptomyces sp. CB02058]